MVSSSIALASSWRTASTSGCKSWVSFLVVWARPGLPDSTAFCLFVVSDAWLLCFVFTLIAGILVGGVVGGLALVSNCFI